MNDTDITGEGQIHGAEPLHEAKIYVLNTDKRDDDFEGAVDRLESDLPQLKRHYRLQAQLYAEFYDGLLEEGFQPDEALALTSSEFKST